MLLIQSVVARAEGVVVCRAVVPQEYPVAWPGAVPPVLAIEIAAQASALLAPQDSTSTETPKPRAGYLVSVRRAEFLCQALPTATPLLVRAASAGQAGPLQMVSFELIQEPDLGEIHNVGVEFDATALLSTAHAVLARGSLGTFQKH
jgi:predicted hotdog family 3-hydroxylacyl-ACP dehydratase